MMLEVCLLSVYKHVPGSPPSPWRSWKKHVLKWSGVNYASLHLH